MMTTTVVLAVDVAAGGHARRCQCQISPRVDHTSPVAATASRHSPLAHAKHSTHATTRGKMQYPSTHTDWKNELQEGRGKGGRVQTQWRG